MALGHDDSRVTTASTVTATIATARLRVGRWYDQDNNDDPQSSQIALISKKKTEHCNGESTGLAGPSRETADVRLCQVYYHKKYSFCLQCLKGRGKPQLSWSLMPCWMYLP